MGRTSRIIRSCIYFYFTSNYNRGHKVNNYVDLKKGETEIAKTTPKVNSGGLDLEAILKDNPDKIARATHNQERHKELNGKTVQQALATRLVDARDIRYDIAKGFMTLGS